VGFVGLIIAHIYFALRPEKLWLTKSMIFGTITRRQYLEHHDPDRWIHLRALLTDLFLMDEAVKGIV
jgi:hypothetical protein